MVESDQGYFCKGKFGQMRSHRPFAALADAFNELCLVVRQNRGNDEQSLRRQLKDILGDETTIGILTNVIPQLGILMSETETSTTDGPPSFSALSYSSGNT